MSTASTASAASSALSAPEATGVKAVRRAKAPAAPKASKAPKAVKITKATKATPPPTACSSAWPAKDDALLCKLGAAGVDVHAVALQLEREPLEVLQRLSELGCHRELAGECAPSECGLDDDVQQLTFEPGSDEALEFAGLALGGLALNEAARWCLAAGNRLSAQQLQAGMPRGDARAAVRLAHEMGLWFVSASQVQALQFLAGEPAHVVRAALGAVVARLDSPTPNVVAQQVLGVPAPRSRPCAWLEQRAGTSASAAELAQMLGGLSGLNAPKKGAKGGKKASPSSPKATSASTGEWNGWAKKSGKKKSTKSGGASSYAGKYSGKRRWSSWGKSRKSSKSAGAGSSSSSGARKSRVAELPPELLEQKDPGWEKRSWAGHKFL